MKPHSIPDRHLGRVHLADFFHPDRIQSEGHERRIRQARQTPGKQVEITPTVEAFASQYRITTDPASLMPLVRDVRRFRPVAVPWEDLQHLYAKRTATDIIHSRKTAILGEEERVEKKNVQGCVDYGAALVAAMNAVGARDKSLGLKARFARHGDRTQVWFTLGGKEYVVDPHRFTRVLEPFEVTPDHRALIEGEAASNKFAIGRDAWDIGMTSIKDFRRYMAGGLGKGSLPK